MNHDTYVNPKTIRQTFDIQPHSLQAWARQGWIKHIVTPTGRWLYSMESIHQRLGTHPDKIKIAYARVSSNKQRGDLDRQIKLLEKEYPGHKIYKDIGSGINFKRKQFNAVLGQIMSGRVSQLVVTHKDRITRFGSELVIKICQQFGTEFLVHFKQEGSSEQEELAQDLLAIVNVFVARNNGRRSHQNQKNKTKSLKKTEKVS